MKIYTNLLMVFSSNNYASLLYSELLKKNYKVEIISTPCSLSAGCSESLKFPEKDLTAVLNIAKELKVPYKKIYLMKVVNREYKYILYKQ